jgi:pimeloyl-ACP methyl ester carboxylesterase
MSDRATETTESNDAAMVSRRVDGLAVYERPATSPGALGGGLVVFVHGSMDRGASFVRAGRVLPYLDIVRYDRRGYGRSAAAGVAPSVEAHADDLLAVIDGRPCVVVGHSFGGVVALTAASRSPGSVGAIGAFEAPMPWDPRWPHDSAGSVATGRAEDDGTGAAAELFLRRMIGDEAWDALPAGTKADRRAEGEALVAELTAMRERDVAPYDLDAIDVPIVSGYGMKGKPYHQWAAAELCQRARHGELITIEGAAHAAHASHPAAFANFARRVNELGSQR